MIDLGRYKIASPPKELISKSKKEEEKEPFSWNGMLFKSVYGKGNNPYVSKFIANARGLRLDLRNEELTVSNSVHKFLKGINYSDFTFFELLESINLLSDMIKTDSALIQPFCLEFEVNLDAANTFYCYNPIFEL